MKRFLAFVLFALLALVACTADYDTFGTSPYKVLKGISFEEQDGDASIYPDEHVIKITTVEPKDSASTWDSLTIESIELSHLASLHLVDGKFKSFPSDSAALDSLAKDVSYVSKKLRAGDKIRIPKSLQVYVMVVAENGDPSIWQLNFTIPGVEAASSSSEGGDDSGDEDGDESSSSGEAESSSGEMQSSSSAVIVLNGNNSFQISFKNQVENYESGDSIYVTFSRGTDLAMVEVDTAIYHRKSKIDVDPKSIDDWSDPQKFVVTAENDSSRTWWVIAQTFLSAKNELKLNFENKFGEPVLSGDTLYVKLKNGETVEKAKLTSYEVSDGAKANPKPDTVSSWSNGKKITVTAENGKEKTYTVCFNIAAADEKLSSENELVSIAAVGQVKDPTMDATEKTLVLHLSSQEAMASVDVAVEVSEFATYSFGVSATDWRQAQTLTIVAQDSSVAVWNVSADYPLSSDAEIVSFSVDGIAVDKEPSIDVKKRVISFDVPFGTDLSNVGFDATYSDKAVKTAPAEDELDLTSGSAKISVEAEDGTVVEWTVSVTVGPEPEPETSSASESSSASEDASGSSTQTAAPRILSMKIAGNAAVVDSIKENGKWVYWVHYDNLEFLSDLSKLKVSDIKLSEGASISGISDGSAYDLGMGVKVSVSNSSESQDYVIHAGYQLPGSDFNTWSSNDVSPDSIWGNANTVLTTTKKYSANGVVGAEIKTGSAVGKIASGSLYTAVFNPKGVGTLAMASSSTWPDGNELLDFGKKFNARPAYMDVTFSYNGSGDSCDVYIVLENRTGDMNRNRSSTDVNKLVASAWYRSTTGDNSGGNNPDVVSVSEANNAGMRTIRLKLKYGTPLDGSPIKNSSVFNTTLASKDSKAINNGVIQGAGDESVTHVRIVFASSADGNHYNGKSGATLVVDEMRLIY